MIYSESERQNIIDQIIQKISEGMSLRSALKSGKYPSRTIFLGWIDSNKEWQNQYARACEMRTELKFESIEQDYSEEPQRDEETGRIDPSWVSLQRLKIDSKKWMLSKMNPKKYGDKLDVEQKHEGEITITRRIINGKS